VSNSVKLTVEKREELHKLWDTYSSNGFKIVHPKENVTAAASFDETRRESIRHIQKLISEYLSGKQDLKAFKSNIDGYNKRNNHWGFAAMKGQMFFNQLWNSSQNEIEKLNSVIKDCIQQPSNLAAAKKKIDKLEDYVDEIGREIEEKRKAPRAGSVAYFLSYFWQIADYKAYPIIYTSLLDSLERLGLWKDFERQSDAYGFFYELINAIKEDLNDYSGKKLTHWDVEHCLWMDFQSAGTASPARPKKQIESEERPVNQVGNGNPLIRGLPLADFLPPVISDLIEAGKLKGDTRAAKGVPFEKKVAMLFRMLDFDVESLGQGRGREPDGVLRFRQENIAFIYDAKVRENGYSLGVDDRAIREYINLHYPKLERDGFKAVGFLIISSEFNSSPEDIIDDLTLHTPIKRVGLVSSEALLYLLAHKLSSGVGTAEIAKALLQNGIITAGDVNETFADL